MRAVVVPWDDKRFQYAVKDLARPAYGTRTLDARLAFDGLLDWAEDVHNRW